VDPEVRADAGVGEQLLGAGTADAVDVRECDLDALVTREVDTDKACLVVALSEGTCPSLFTVVWSCRVSGFVG
jgi:hypothetical protein